MFCLDIPNPPFGWQPCFLRLLPCFIHFSSIHAAKLKSGRPAVCDPRDVLMRSLTLQSMFSTSASAVSFEPRWLGSICFHNIRLQHISIGDVSPLRPSREVRCGRRGSRSRHMRVNVQICESFLLAALRVSSSPSPSDCCFRWSWTACCYQAWGTACLLLKKKKKKRGVKINSSLNKFVKAASKGVQHLLWHSYQFDVTLREICAAWPIACTLWRNKELLFLTRDW